MTSEQTTIKKKIIFEGIGLHSGIVTKLVLLPAETDSGINFLRSDLAKSKPISALWNNIKAANLCTKITNKNGDTVSTIEHLMFALYSLGITNLFIEINGPEVPILDGSAKVFIDEILATGLLKQNKKIKILNVLKSFEIQTNNKFIKYEPHNKAGLEIDYTINYQDQFIKKQSYHLKNVQNNYLEVFDSRTFCHQEDLEKIFAMGLAKGGSLENAIVISGNKILNQEGLRHQNEFVRHKILDCIGDLYLSGFFINGKIICRQGGHELTASLLNKIFENKKNYFIEDIESKTHNASVKKISNKLSAATVV